MSLTDTVKESLSVAGPVLHRRRVGGSRSAATRSVIDSSTEEVFFTRGRGGPRTWTGPSPRPGRPSTRPWPRHDPRRAGRLSAGDRPRSSKQRTEDIGQIWPRESGVLQLHRPGAAGTGARRPSSYYAGLAETFPFEERPRPRPEASSDCSSASRSASSARSSRGTRPMGLISNKVAPALLAGCTVILKASPEAPGEAYVVAEVAEAIGLPAGVLNVVTADREVSELLVRDPGVDKITFTGSTAAGRRIASICGERIARCTLELGGKSAAVVLDDMDIATAAAHDHRGGVPA